MPKIIVNPFTPTPEGPKFNAELGLAALEFYLREGETPPQWLIDELKKAGREDDIRKVYQKIPIPKRPLRVLSRWLKVSDRITFEEYLKKFTEELGKVLEELNFGITTRVFKPDVIFDKLKNNQSFVDYTLDFARSIGLTPIEAARLLRNLIWDAQHFIQVYRILDKFDELLSYGHPSVAKVALYLDPFEFREFVRSKYAL